MLKLSRSPLFFRCARQRLGGNPGQYTQIAFLLSGSSCIACTLENSCNCPIRKARTLRNRDWLLRPQRIESQPCRPALRGRSCLSRLRPLQNIPSSCLRRIFMLAGVAVGDMTLNCPPFPPAGRKRKTTGRQWTPTRDFKRWENTRKPTSWWKKWTRHTCIRRIVRL